MSTNDVFLSKTLSWLLRHSAATEGLSLTPEGFAPVSEVLNHRQLRGKFTVEDIQRIVESNNKQRFFLRQNGAILEIRANQGHSMQVTELELASYLNDPNVDVVHGTFFRNLDAIKRIGLSRMSRNHIHFTRDLALIRKNVQVLIYIDVAKALSDGIKFYMSSNGVILSPGNEKGILEPKYFWKIVKR
ncbi:tRNA 2'-phosphotransferase 1 [Tribolium castaneum]|uniref:2'-phosphotransferase n=1 Tax=Tribolium castaneum TaxID=7070 RepID=D2A1V5_TRICA|nr:PREDICTED: tRNA 2'-phosphotransferase 1 [Tribolium castaneum]EFA02080.1 tRNA 2'-phosphotransferase 1-like Protein [Tribolium castaneum]|eukprot:XP_972212.1 PREDICTED: tRNA 2'-phosphotransferase 1 [Tribolium castaneum]